MSADEGTIKELIYQTLRADERLCSPALPSADGAATPAPAAEQAEFNHTKLIDLAEPLDERIIGALLQNPTLKAKFFTRIHEALVFRARDFRFFIEEHKLDNSYTRYKNRIGLTDGRRYLRDSADVVLDWPYKD